jgi:hypothetical protein
MTRPRGLPGWATVVVVVVVVIVVVVVDVVVVGSSGVSAVADCCLVVGALVDGLLSAVSDDVGLAEVVVVSNSGTVVMMSVEVDVVAGSSAVVLGPADSAPSPVSEPDHCPLSIRTRMTRARKKKIAIPATIRPPRSTVCLLPLELIFPPLVSRQRRKEKDRYDN